MNTSIIRYILGYVLKLEAIFLCFPIVVALIYREPAGLAYLITAFICAVIGILATLKKPERKTFYLKEGCVATALSWIVLSLAGALPFVISGEIHSYTDALFETISGFTTTGASILSDVEALSHCNLFWRSFTHWIGGMGVIVFLLAIIPLSGASNINLMKAESPGPSVGKLIPKIRSTARILYLIYLALTFIEILLLCFGGMPIFEALCTSFGTAGTGGFGVKNTSIAGYSAYIQWVVTVFMILFGVNFNVYYMILLRRFKKAVRFEEVRCYLIIIIVAIAIIYIDNIHLTESFFETIRHSSFQVASIITTTGFSTYDFNTWSQSSKIVLVLLMFIGACAGSTGGGIKVSRIVILFKTIVKELGSYIHPKSVKKIKIDGKPVDHEVVRATNVFFITFIIIFTASIFILSFDGNDFITTFTSVAATINNIGPGLELTGPSGNYGFFSDYSKYVLMFDMLAGRLELFPLLIMLHPAIWKDMLHVKRRRKASSVR